MDGYIVSAIWVGATVLTQFIWSAAFFKCRRSDRVRRYILLLNFLVCFLAANLNPVPGLNILMTLSCYILCSFYLYKAPWYMHLLVSVFGVLLVILCETGIFYLFASIVHMSFQEIIPHKVTYTLIGMTAYSSALLIAWVVYKVKSPKRDHSRSTPQMLLCILFPVTSNISLWFVFSSNQELASRGTPIFLFTLIHAAANAAVFYLLHLTQKQASQAHERDLLQQQMRIQADSFAALQKNYREQRSSVHNFKNQLQVIHDLLAQGEAERAQTYIEELQDIQTTRIFAINTHHPTIDAVLNQKYQIAKENHIDFQAKVNDLSQVHISTDHLIVILANLLDNALEACLALPENRSIQVTLLKEGSLYLSIRNTSKEVKILEGSIATTKKPAAAHGFGLPCVKNLLEQLNAEFTLHYENGWFQFAAEIPNP